MSRRDTIIIAVLVNICLLAFLFMLAINTDKEEDAATSTEIAKVSLESTPSVPLLNPSKETSALVAANTTASNEVDNFLKNLSAHASSQPIEANDEGFVELEKGPTPIAKPSEAKEKEKEDAGFVEVTVKKGDALEKIARNNGITVDAIKKANNLTSTKLSIGQVLRVPIGSKKEANKKESTQIASEKPAATPASKDKDKKTEEPQYYTVKSGDSPWKIAKKYDVNFEDLLRMNHLDEEKARNLKVGDQLRVR